MIELPVNALNNGVVFQQGQRPLHLVHIWLCRQDRIVCYDLFQNITHGTDGILFQAQPLLILLIDHAQSQQDGCFLFVQITAVCLVGVDHIEIAIQRIFAQIPIQKAKIVLHGLIMQRQKRIVRIVHPSFPGAIQGPHHIGPAKELVAYRLKLFQLLGGCLLNKVEIHFFFSFRRICI